MRVLLAPGRPEVTPIPGERFRYHVASSKKDDPPYLCDIQSKWPLGECSCEDWSCRRWPDFKRTLYPVRCKHLLASLEFHALRDVQEHTPHLGFGDGE